MIRVLEITGKPMYLYFKQFSGFGRDVEFILMSEFFAITVWGLSNIILPLYLSALGYDTAIIGVLLGIPAIVSIAILLPSGMIADRYGRKKVLLLSSFAFMLVFIIYATSKEFSLLTVASVLMGVSYGAWVGPSNALLSDKAEPKQRKYIFSFYSFISAIAAIIGSLLAGATDLISSALQQSSLEALQTMFWASAGLSFIASIILLFVHETNLKKQNRILTIKSWKLIGKFSVVNGLIGFGVGVFIPLLPIYLRSKFYATEAEIGILFAISNAVMGVASLFAPKLSERIGLVTTIIFTQGLSAIPLAIIPSSNIFYWTGLLYVFRTAFMSMSSAILNAFTMNMVLHDERASASGIISMFWDGGNALGIIISGVLMGLYLDSPFYLSSAFYILAILFFYASFRRQNPPE